MSTLGRFLFRWRGIVFPLVILMLAVAFPPRLARSSLDQGVIALGLAVLIAGQGLRALTIGWDYIERGGKGGRVSASRLVTGGMYAYCRNPMYVGNLLLVAGFLLVFGRLGSAIIGLAACFLFYSAIVACEESFLQQKFGPEFSAYRARVPRWGIRIPALLREFKVRATDVKSILLREYSTLSVTTLSAGAIATWRLKGEAWDVIEVAVLCSLAGAVFGFYLTMRYLKTRRIVYAPR